MRDTSLLRTRLHTVLACLPFAAVGACGGPAPQPAKVEAAKEAPASAPAAAAAPARTPAPAPPPYVSPYPARTGLDPHDPDGIEEEGCPNGDWCGSPAAARQFASKAPTATEELGCPARLQGTPNPPVKPEDKTFKGLSLNPMMQGRLRKIATAEQRQATGKADLCCYHWFDYCSGRPLLDDELAGLRAPLQPGGTWLMGHVPEDLQGELPPAARRELAARWLADAQDEHASVAAFARATLELLAVGAPPELVFASQAASLDEVRHAQACFTLAARYSGEAVEPGPLPAVTPRGGGLVALACNTFMEGCVGETIAALAARRAGRRCQIPEVQSALAGIAEDETRHAELAWATLAYAVRTGGPEVAAAVRALAAELAPRGDASTTPDTLSPALLAAHGRLGAAELEQVRRDAWLEVLAPTLDLVLADTPAADAADHLAC